MVISGMPYQRLFEQYLHGFFSQYEMNSQKRPGLDLDLDPFWSKLAQTVGALDQGSASP